MWVDEHQRAKCSNAVKQEIESEEDSSGDDTEKCPCRKGCATRVCSCFKNGDGCSSSCGCSAICRNMFNHLEYFFGNDEKYSAHSCFAQWLKKTVKNADALQMMDRDKLRGPIVKSHK